MNEKQKSQLIAEAENVEAIRDFFTEWWSVEQLYEAEAKAAVAVLYVGNKLVMCDEDIEALKNLINQHKMMIELIKPFAPRKEEEV